jgi:hypothetical protein
MPMGAYAVTSSIDADIEPGIIFCLKAEGPGAAASPTGAGAGDYPLAPIYLAHVGDDGATLLAYPQAKRILDRLKRLALGRELPDLGAISRHDKQTRHGEEMRHAQKLLASAVASVVGKSEERAVASLFSPGGTHAMKGEFAGAGDFEVLAFMVVLPNQNTQGGAS